MSSSVFRLGFEYVFFVFHILFMFVEIKERCNLGEVCNVAKGGMIYRDSTGLNCLSGLISSSYYTGLILINVEVNTFIILCKR